METVGLAAPMTIAAKMGSSWLSTFNLTTTTSKFVNCTFPLSLSFKDKTRTSCSCRGREDDPLSTSSAYAVLGVQPDCSASDIKAAFRSKVQIPSINIYSLFSFTSIQVSIPSLIYYTGEAVPPRCQQRWKFWCYDSLCNSSIPSTT
jgi:hypothetical protein